jgi:hypothetical protein
MTITYVKPEIVELVPAVEAIRSRKRQCSPQNELAL